MVQEHGGGEERCASDDAMPLDTRQANAIATSHRENS